jgi:hypothetical protein
LKLKLTEAQSVLYSLQDKDWAATNLQLKREVELLRQELSDKHKELTDMKEGVKVAM